MKAVKQIKLFLIITVLMTVAGMTSCFNTDLDNISDKIVWAPELSIPIGEADFSIPLDEAELIDTKEFYTPPPDLWYDTLDFSISSIIDNDDIIDTLVFRINMTNEFPAQGDIYVFYPENGQLPSYSRSLTGDKPIEIAPGEIGGQGKVTIPQKKQLDIPVSDDQINDMLTSNYIVVRTVIRNMYVTGAIKNNLTTYTFSTQLGVQAKIVRVYGE